MIYSRKISTGSAASRSALVILGDDFEWQNGGALCESPDVNPDWWFPSTGQSRHYDVLAKAVCDRCPIRRKCLDKGWDEEGTWGGMTESERRAEDAS